MSQVPAAVRKGRFIAIDGPDFCGKGTQTRMLVNYLMDHPSDREFKLISVLATREPSNSQFGVQVRQRLASAKDPRAEAQAFTTLFIEDRRDHIEKVIMPNVRQGNIVVSDRYMYSTMAYQHAQGIPIERLLEDQASFPAPDLSIIILPSVEQMLRRKAASRDRPYDEVFEKSHVFIGQVRDNYAKMKQWLPSHNIVMLDGDRSIDAIFADIKAYVDMII